MFGLRDSTVTIKAFKKCCISNSMDGTEDDIIWEHFVTPKETSSAADDDAAAADDNDDVDFSEENEFVSFRSLTRMMNINRCGRLMKKMPSLMGSRQWILTALTPGVVDSQMQNLA